MNGKYGCVALALLLLGGMAVPAFANANQAIHEDPQENGSQQQRQHRSPYSMAPQASVFDYSQLGGVYAAIKPFVPKIITFNLDRINGTGKFAPLAKRFSDANPGAVDALAAEIYDGQWDEPGWSRTFRARHTASLNVE